MLGPAFADHHTKSFLLIVRTERIFTTHTTNLTSVCDMNEYRRILGVSSIWPTTHRIVADTGGSYPLHSMGSLNLRTVIVTAAVYRGLGSELRPKTNPSP